MSSAGRRTVAVLFARRDSVYKNIRGCAVYDEERDARTYAGNLPVIAHPPCRAWGGLRHMAKPLPGERELAIFALAAVRRCGGVLEHPARSELWPVMDLPMGDEVDEFGGYSLKVNQCWWGHPAEKDTLLYVVGIERSAIPPVVVDITAPAFIVGSSGRSGNGGRLRADGAPWRSDLSKKLREATPPAFAHWLVQIARRAAPAEFGAVRGRHDLHGARVRRRARLGRAARATCSTAEVAAAGPV